MKRLFITGILFCVIHITARAQNDMDVLRYSQTGIGGDSRFLSLGGSMGALGANLSTINYNPAGMGLYRKGEFAITAGLRFANTTSTHYGTSSNDFKANVPLGLIGFASAWEEVSPYQDEKSKKKFKNWSRRHAIGFTYNKLANFNQNITISGKTKDETIIADFLASAQTHQPKDLNMFYEGLAFNTWLIDTFPGTLTEYGTYFETHKPFNQKKIMNVTGSLGEYSFAYSYAMDNKTYFGAALGVPSGKWNYSATYEEDDDGAKRADPTDNLVSFNSLTYRELIQTRAIGVNLKLGVISRVSDNLRVGAYFHTPTAYSLRDNYSNSMSVLYDTLFTLYNVTLSDSSDPGNFRYKMSTPMKVGGSIAYLYEKLIAFNIDAEYLSYQQGSLKSNEFSFAEVNDGIRQKYSSTFNFRAGIELNTSPVLFRLGFASYGSPFGNMLTGKNVKNSYCAGIGFRKNEKTFFDIALVMDRYSEDHYLYGPKYVNPSTIKYSTTNIVFTYGVKF